MFDSSHLKNLCDNGFAGFNAPKGNTMKPIAHIESDFPEKFGIPRQSGIVPELQAKIVFETEFLNPDYIRGIEGFSHLWLIWLFSEVPTDRKASPTVRPPRLGGNTRMGVFATRSPFRPNPIGLSSVRLEQVVKEKNGSFSLWISGADLMHGTPILDIKPYLPYTDSHPEAVGGFADEKPRESLSVTFPDELLSRIPAEKRDALLRLLACDPRPSYQNDPDRRYHMNFSGFRISFQVKEETLAVAAVEIAR